VRSLREVDHAYIVHTSDTRQAIEDNGVNIVVHGDDWEHESYMKQICVDEEYLRRNQCELRYVPYYPHTSTSRIISRIREEGAECASPMKISASCS
jgi:glycerol-3-phosphate cytidylyltransferase